MRKKSILFVLIALITISIQAQDTLRLRVMTYNLRFGEHASMTQIAEHIKAFAPDFVALQEVDVNTQRKATPKQNGVNFISELADKTNMLGLYGKAINFSGGYYGIGMLSRFPYINVNKITLPNPNHVEGRVMLEATFEVANGDTITFAVTHLDYKEESTRCLQAKCINKYFAHRNTPIIIGGDFNATPDASTIKDIMMPTWFSATNSELTFPAWKPRVKIDYIFARPLRGWKLIRTQAIQSSLSDHLPVITELEYVKQ